ncbi:MAG: class II aldolase/adducin family protein [Acidobacteriota bacterium]
MARRMHSGIVNGSHWQSQMMNDFASLIRFSERVGNDPLRAPGTSGNTSVKTDKIVWVKSSGKALRNSACEETFVPVDLASVFDALPSGLEPLPCGNYPTNLRPSIETWTHAFLPQKVVVHLHAVNTVAWSLHAAGESELRERLHGLRWAWIPYTLSGRDLGREVLTAARSEPDVLVLANHGLVVAAPGFPQAEALLEEVERRLQLLPRAGRHADIGALQSRIDAPGWQVPVSRRLHGLGTDPASFQRAMGGDLYPCHVLYLKDRTGILGGGMTVSSAAERHEAVAGCKPLILLSLSEGVLIHRDLDSEAQEHLVFLSEVLARIEPDIPLRRLTREQIGALTSLASGLLADTVSS